MKIKKCLFMVFSMVVMGLLSSCSIEFANDDDVNGDNGKSKEKGCFTVSSDGKKVKFAKGNLQYCPSTKDWRFAENQWEFMAYENDKRTDPTFTGWIDLFAWSTEESDYGLIIDAEKPEIYYGEFKDWGKLFNDNEWYTLSRDEWYYLRSLRPNAFNLKTAAKVHSKNGLIVFPDDFVNPGVDYVIADYYSSNNLSDADWSKLEAAGAIFLPAAGYYTPDGSKYNESAHYWSSETFIGYASTATFLVAPDYSSISNSIDCYLGSAVRLARVVE